VGPRPEGISRQIRQEWMAGEIQDRERASQRTSGHVSPTGEPELQSPSYLQRLPSAVPVLRPSSAPGPLSSLSLDVTHLAGKTEIGRPYSAPDIFRQQKRSPFALANHPSFQSLHIPTNTEIVQAKIADRDVQIQALESKISYLGGIFGAESQEVEAAVKVKIVEFEVL
jgi:hypothetical protein